jgi:hypothetical protein
MMGKYINEVLFQAQIRTSRCQCEFYSDEAETGWGTGVPTKVKTLPRFFPTILDF